MQYRRLAVCSMLVYFFSALPNSRWRTCAQTFWVEWGVCLPRWSLAHRLTCSTTRFLGEILTDSIAGAGTSALLDAVDGAIGNRWERLIQDLAAEGCWISSTAFLVWLLARSCLCSLNVVSSGTLYENRNASHCCALMVSQARVKCFDQNMGWDARVFH